MHFVNIFLINDENYINFLGTFACFCPACKMQNKVGYIDFSSLTFS